MKFFRRSAQLLALMFVSIGAFAQSDLDAVKVDAAHHKVEFENDQVRVVSWVIPPGESTANHSHPDLVSIYLADGDGVSTSPDGKTTEVHPKAGSVAWRTGLTHVVKNVGTTPMKGILVEPKKPSSSLPPGAKGAVEADPKHTKVEFENELVRVIRFHFEPGEKSPMHGHPDYVQVMLTDGKSTVTTADGKSEPRTLKAGAATWNKATQHTVENTGGQAYEGILVEMKGPGAKQ